MICTAPTYVSTGRPQRRTWICAGVCRGTSWTASIPSWRHSWQSACPVLSWRLTSTQPLRAKISRYANHTLLVMPDAGILVVLIGACLALTPLWYTAAEQRALLLLLLSVLLMATYDVTNIASRPAEGFILALVSFFTIAVTCIVNSTPEK
jgi:hypothetical protein